MKTETIQKSSIVDAMTDYINCSISGKGKFELNGSVRINRTFSGALKVNGTLTVDLNARITGEIFVKDLIVYGQIAGSASVTNKAVFNTLSVFSGTLTAGEAEFHEGSRISGNRNIGNAREKEVHNTYIENKGNKDNKYIYVSTASIPTETSHKAFMI